MSLTIIIDPYKAAKMKSHKLVETLIKPCALEMVKACLDGEAQKTSTDSSVVQYYPQ